MKKAILIFQKVWLITRVIVYLDKIKQILKKMIIIQVNFLEKWITKLTYFLKILKIIYFRKM